MIFTLKERIFGYFGRRDKIKDEFKDVDGRGLHERFNRLLAGDLDDNELSLINNLVENTQNPRTVFPKFLTYREQTFGLPIFSSDEAIRRKILCIKSRLNRRRGTISGYEILLNILGYTNIVITEIEPSSGFDSPVTFDDPDRFFDQKCKACSGYILSFEGAGMLTPDKLAEVMRVVEYNEPINAKLLSIEYNDVAVDLIDVWIDEFGDLWYNNDNDPTTTLQLDLNGDVLLDSGKNYFIDENGDFIFKFVT